MLRRRRRAPDCRRCSPAPADPAAGGCPSTPGCRCCWSGRGRRSAARARPVSWPPRWAISAPPGWSLTAARPRDPARLRGGRRPRRGVQRAARRCAVRGADPARHVASASVGTALITSSLAVAVAAPVTHLEHPLVWPDPDLSYLFGSLAVRDRAAGGRRRAGVHPGDGRGAVGHRRPRSCRADSGDRGGRPADRRAARSGCPSCRATAAACSTVSVDSGLTLTLARGDPACSSRC